MEQEQIRQVAQRVEVAAWPVAERYLRRTRKEFTAAEHSIAISRFQGAAIDYLNRGDAERASELLKDAASVEAALRVLQKHDAMFKSHAQLLNCGAFGKSLKSFADALRRGAAALKKYPKNRGFFYCLGGRFMGETLPTAEEAVEVHNAFVEAVRTVAPDEVPGASYGLPEDGATIRTAMKIGQDRK